jgi:hypothetical protein
VKEDQAIQILDRVRDMLLQLPEALTKGLVTTRADGTRSFKVSGLTVTLTLTRLVAL